MGNCKSSDNSKTSKMLDQYLESDKKKFNEEIKLLLLGAGESGKSTIFKQMKILQDNGGYTQKELEGFRYVIHGNCITQMKLLVEAAIKSGAHMDESLMQSANRIREVPTTNVGSSWSDQLAKDIVALWKSDTIQTVFRERDGTFQLNDSMDYFFSNVDRFNQINYVPTVEDVLRARVRSLGIEEAEFMFESVKFRMVDVGGQRSERRKWIHCFDHVSAVIFCVALSEYDQVLREEEGMNRMKESLLLWEEIVNSKHFRTTPFILFLNKTDLFREKLKKIPLTSVYPNYVGGDDFDAASNFIKARYIELNQYPHEIFSHFTCAISTENIGFVFGAVRKTLLKQLISEHTI